MTNAGAYLFPSLVSLLCHTTCGVRLGKTHEMLIFEALPCSPKLVAVSTQPGRSTVIRNPDTNDDRESRLLSASQPSPSQTENAYLLACLHHHPSIRSPFMHRLVSTHVQRALPLASRSPICDCPCRICRARSLCANHATRRKALQVMFLFFCSDSNEPFHCADQPMFRLQKRSCMLFP